MDNLTWSCVSSMVNFLNFYFAKVYLAIIETKVWQFIFAGNSLLWSVDMPANWGIKCNILAGRMLCPTYILMILLSFCSWKKVIFVSLARVESFHILSAPYGIGTISQIEVPEKKDQIGNTVFPTEITWLVFVLNRKSDFFLPNILRNIKISNYANRCSSSEITFIL